MDSKTKDKIEKSLEVSKLSSIHPDEDELSATLALKSSDLASLTDQDLSRSIFTLAQYQVWLQTYCNIKHIVYLDAKRVFEIALTRASKNLDGKTLKEKSQKALEADSALQSLERDLKAKEHDYFLFDKIPETISDLANALKKELSIRTPNYKR